MPRFHPHLLSALLAITLVSYAGPWLAWETWQVLHSRPRGDVGDIAVRWMQQQEPVRRWAGLLLQFLWSWVGIAMLAAAYRLLVKPAPGFIRSLAKELQHGQ